MTTLDKILTLLGMTFLMAALTACDEPDKPSTESGDPDHRGYGKPTRPRVYGEKTPIQANGKCLVFTVDYSKGPVKVVCRNIGSGETIHSTVTAESPVLELTSEGVWEVEISYAGERYHEIVEVKGCATATE